MTPDALLEAILEDPEGALRLVYADWLQENGATPEERALGEFIRAEVQAARLPPDDPAGIALAEQSERLRSEYGDRW